MKILFVCTGNTCRSPMAEGIMNKLAKDNELNIKSQSAGIFANPNSKVSNEAVLASQKYNVDISSHVSKQLIPQLISDSDLILTMTQGHKMILKEIAPDKVFTINEYAGTGGDISDPYGGDLEEYKQVCEEIYNSIVDIIVKLSDECNGSEDNN